MNAWNARLWHRLFWGAALGAGLVAAQVGCSAGGGGGFAPAGCVPLQATECSCGLGVRGAQTCNAAGTGYGSCSCSETTNDTATNPSAALPDGGLLAEAGNGPDASASGCGVVSAGAEKITATVYGHAVSLSDHDATDNNYDPKTNETRVWMGNEAGEAIEITFAGGTTGTFDCSAARAPYLLYGVTHSVSTGKSGDYAAGEGDGACHITVTAYGCVGEAIRGTFTATGVEDFVPSQAYPGVSTVSMSGTFDVIRQADEK